jgi:hypothetical protein
MGRLDIHPKSYIDKNIDKNVFSHVYLHLHKDESLIEFRGKLFSAVDVSGPQGFDANKYLDSFLDDLESTYFTNTVSSVLNVLDSSLNFAYNNLQKSIIDANVEGDIDFNVTCFVVWGDVGYMARIGTSLILLFRDGKLMNLSDHLLTSGNNIVATASGFLKANDNFILATPHCSLYIDESRWRSILNLDQKQLGKLEVGSKRGEVSFIILDVFDTNKEVEDTVLKSESFNKEENSGHINDNLIHNNIISDKVKEFDFGSKFSDFSKKVASGVHKGSSNVMYAFWNYLKKVDWKAILKSIFVVLYSFISLVYNTIMYIANRKKSREYKNNIAKDFNVFRKEKYTVLGIIVFILIIIFFF